MAGSYRHVVEDDGKLSSPENINGMLECVSGDVVECVREMYGMIWYLATYGARDGEVPADLVEEARKNHKDGLAMSPGLAEWE